MKKYNWIKMLVKKITRTDCDTNQSFYYFNNIVELQSGMRNYVDVWINHNNNFSFDFDTKELVIFTGCEDFKYILISSFKEIYGCITITDDTLEL